MKDYHAFEVGEREAAGERYQAEQDRRDRHMPVILESRKAMSDAIIDELIAYHECQAKKWAEDFEAHRGHAKWAADLRTLKAEHATELAEIRDALRNLALTCICGHQPQVNKLAMEAIVKYKIECESCDGNGWVICSGEDCARGKIRDGTNCPDCDGRGHVACDECSGKAVV